MSIFNFISRIWELISRIARVIAKIDDALIDAKGFWDWLFGEPDETGEER